jgi:hypothetical protein
LTLQTTARADGGTGGGIEVQESISVGGNLTLIAASAQGALDTGVRNGGTGGSITVLADLSAVGAINIAAGNATAGGSAGTGGDVTISGNIVATGGLNINTFIDPNTLLPVVGGSVTGATSTGGNAGDVTITGQITLGAGSTSFLQAGNGNTVANGGNLVISAPITGANSTLTLTAGTGKTGGVLTLNSGSPIGTSSALLNSVTLAGDGVLSIGSEIYSSSIILAPITSTG